MNDLKTFIRNFTINFSTDVNDFLKCTICKNVLVDAYVSLCACKFCSSCINECLRNGGIPCPGVKEECRETFIHTVNDLEKDLVADRQITFLTIECPNENCNHRCQLRKILEHMRTCSKAPVECVFSYVGCMDASVACDKMKQHLDEWSVSHARSLVAHIRNMENEMKERMDRYKMSLETLTTEKVVLQSVVDKNIAEIHRLKEANRVLLSKEETLLQENAALKGELQTFRENATVLRQKVYRNAAEIEEMKEEISALSSKAEYDKPEFRMPRCTFKRRLEERKIKFAKVRWFKEEPANTIHKLPAVVMSELGAFVWRIEGISTKFGKEEYSRPFFSSGPSGGYKLCLRYTMTTSAGLYLTFHLMRGLDDHRLQWPMNRAVLIEILDEQLMVPVMSCKVCCTTVAQRNMPGVRKRAYERPTSVRNKCGDGFVRCARYHQIKSIPGAIRNDSMTVRCCVLLD